MFRKGVGVGMEYGIWIWRWRLIWIYTVGVGVCGSFSLLSARFCQIDLYVYIGLDGVIVGDDGD